jgi:hypothetical protein
LQINVIPYEYYSGEKTCIGVLFMHPTGMVARKLLHSTAKSHNFRTELPEVWIDGGAIAIEEICTRDDQGLRKNQRN